MERKPRYSLLHQQMALTYTETNATWPICEQQGALVGRSAVNSPSCAAATPRPAADRHHIASAIS